MTQRPSHFDEDTLDPEAWCKKARIQLDNGFVDDAIRALGRAQLLTPPDHVSLIEGTSTLLLQLPGHPSAAILHTRMARMLAENRDYQRALKHANALAAIRPADVDAHRLLANLHEDLGATAAAADAWSRVLWLAPDDHGAAIALARSLADLDRKDSALMLLHAISDRVPDTQEFAMGLARAYRGAGSVDASIRQYRNAIRLTPMNAEAFLELGTTLFAAGAVDEAEASIKRAAELVPSWAEPPIQLAEIYQAQERNEEAREMLKRAQARAPSNPRLQRVAAAAATPTNHTKEVITGDLAVFPLPELLEFISHRRLSGTLQLKGEGGEATIDLFEGQLASAACTGLPDLADVLRKEGISFTADAATSPTKTQVAFRHLQELLGQIVAWRKGQISFLTSNAASAQPEILFNTQIALLETMRRLDEAQAN